MPDVFQAAAQFANGERFVVTSLAEPTPKALYRGLYCARGQDENFIKAVKNDLASDRARLTTPFSPTTCACFMPVPNDNPQTKPSPKT